MQLVLFCYIYLYYKNETKRTEVVDGSNESLYHADEEMYPLARTFLLLQTGFKDFLLKPKIREIHTYNKMNGARGRLD